MQGIYTHYKNGEKYELIGSATIERTKEKYILYKALYGEMGLWIRPHDMFFEEVELDGKQIPRFLLTEPKEEKKDKSLAGKKVRHSETGDTYQIYYSTYGDILVRKIQTGFNEDEMAEFESPDMWEKQERTGSWGNR